MAYWVDDSFATWPEVFRVGTAAAGLYTRCGAYCAANTTDGHIPLEVATSWGTREWIQKLVEVGLWETEESGYRDVYYLVAPNGNKLNPTKAEVDDKREKARARQAKKRGRQGSPNPVTRDSPVTNAGRTRGSHGGGSRAPSLPPSKEGEGGRAPASQGAAHAPPSSDSPAVDWRTLPAYGTPPDPAHAHRATRGAAAARQAIRPPDPKPKRQPGQAIDALNQLLDAHLPPKEDDHD